MMLQSDACFLLLDASSPTLHAGVLQGACWRAHASINGDALEALHDLVKQVLAAAGVQMRDIHGLVHCEGPGGLLGLRLAAMSIEAWHSLPSLADKPLLTYRSLNLAAAVLEGQGESGFVVVAPFRRGLWCCCEGAESSLALRDEAELLQQGKSIRCIPQRHLKVLPAGAQILNYEVERLPEVLAKHPSLLREAEAATVYVPEENDYKRWSGDRHRA